MQSEWLYIGLFLVIGIIVPLVPLLFARVVAPRKPNPIKQSTYECGIETVGEAWLQYTVGYYLFAILFLIFDVEAIFLFPWAVVMKDAGITGFVEILIFFSILGLGLLYGWKKHALKWE